MHHIVFDAWSIGIFIQELSELYESYCQKKSPTLPHLSIQYADFAIWQHQQLQRNHLENQLNYWKEKLAGVSPILEFPTDKLRPSVKQFRGQSESFEIDRFLTEQLKALSKDAGATLFMTLLAAFSILLARYSRQKDIAIGSPVSNRNDCSLESLIGFFVNTLVFRVQLIGNPSFRELLSEVRQTALEAYSNQDLPLEKLVEELSLDRSLSHNPLFQVMFSLNTAPEASFNLLGLKAESWDWKNTTAQFDLTLAMKETKAGLEAKWEYDTDLFEPKTIQQAIEHFKSLLRVIVEDPDRKIAHLNWLNLAEIQQLQRWNDTTLAYPQQTLVDLFEEQVLKTPDAIAVSFQGRNLSYQMLNQQANQLAHDLCKNHGVQPNTPVGICLERSLTMMIAVLGILKAGGTYIPIDPRYPQERIHFILENSAAALVLTQSSLEQLVSQVQASYAILYWESLTCTTQPVSNPCLTISRDDLAYIIYTSGSTGRPKGVGLSQGALVNLLQWQRNLPDFDKPSKTLQFTTLSFDVSFQEIFSTWSTGGELVLIEDDVRRDMSALIHYLSVHQIERLYLPFVALQHLADYGIQEISLSLKHVITAGEQLRITPSIRAFFSTLPQCRLHNHYGPTESHVVTALTLPAVVEEWEVLPSIGQPIANNRIYILDENQEPVGIGVPGEIYIAGAGLAQGYWKQPELTQSRVLSLNFQGTLERVYKTGDLARWQSNGNLEYLGRIDHQVKIRGFRIELGEIEVVLAQHPQVDKGVVTVQEIHPGHTQLVAYVVGAQKISTSEIREFLKQKLPSYMIPSFFMTLGSLPVSANGKLDRHALPTPTFKIKENDNIIRPRSAVELELIQVWESILNVAPIGLKDNFFDLGGHSLMSVHLMNRIEQQFGQRLPVSVLFEDGTVEHVAALLNQDSKMSRWSRSTLMCLQSKGTHPPFFCVHPGAGTVVWYRELARYLAPDFPFYALESLGLDEEQQPYDRVEDMATHYIREMRKIQPEGPYYLGGWCFGAVVAYEMAQQLNKQELEVRKLILIDMNIDNPIDREEVEIMSDDVNLLVRLFKRDLQNLPQKLENIKHFDKEQQLLRLIEEIQAAQKIPHDFDVLQVKRLLSIFRGHLQGLVTYVPKAYSGQAVLFQALEGDAAYADDQSLGWKDLVGGGIQIYWLPGTHISMFQEPHVQELAQKLRAILLNTDCVEEVSLSVK